MRRIGLHLYQVHVADGFSSDCDELVHRCLQVDNLDFQKFCKIWKEMNFDLLYQGRTSSAEIAELSEEFIHIAKHYMVKDTSYFAESATGLFLVYSLLNLQPFSGFASLRIVPNDVRAINRLELVARRERKLDILYILGEVLLKWTQYHADERPRGMESSLRKYLEGYTSIDKLGMRPMGVFYRQNEELDHLRDLGAIIRQYTHAKKCLTDDDTSDPSLQYINENLATELNTSLRKLVSGIIDESEDEHDSDDHDGFSSEEEKMAEERSLTVQAIKQKAMSKSVDPVKHLISAEERKKSKTTSLSKSDLKKPTGKIKIGNHTKVVTVSPKKKRKIEEIPPKKKGTPKTTAKRYITAESEADLNIQRFSKMNEELILEDSADEIEMDDETLEESNKEDYHTNEQSVDIDIDSLPLIMRTENWTDEIEIEIIDQTKTAQSKQQTELNPNMPHNDTSSDEDDDKPLSLKIYKKTRTYKRDREIVTDVKKHPLIKKPDKREQKRSELKSKFKKMGILPIANFSEPNETEKK